MFFLMLASAALVVSLLFNSLGAFSLYRFPDVYTRLHGATKCTTFGTIFIAIAGASYAIAKLPESGENRFWVLIVHSLVAMMVLLVTNATGAHALARASHRSGLAPAKAVVDRLEESRSKGGGSQ